VPRDATSTRERLLRAGEHLFARKGVAGALTREIVALAGQANDSAVHYHFGSRRGLLGAIVDRHVLRMEEQRKPALDALVTGDPDVGAVLAAVVEPMTAELTDDSGRDFLRIVAQLAGESGARSGEVPHPLAGTALAGQLALLHARCRDHLAEPVARERIAIAIVMLTAALADRALRIDEHLPLLLDHDAFTTNLTTMLTAALTA
jgi:TetR/AcrR family transcriptional regulator, regulator of cefoperazone and chloramphenicol sensitivity